MTRSAPDISARSERAVISGHHGELALAVTIRPEAEQNSQNRSPFEIAFALDRSGSMSGEPIRLVKEAVNLATSALSEQDRVALVVYDNDIDVLHPLSFATARARTELIRSLEPIDARGSTNLSGGWLTSCRQLSDAPPAPSSRSVTIRRSILLTDGLANVGETGVDRLCTHASELRNRGVTTTTMGVGAGFDEFLLSSMSESGGGNFQYIPEPEDLRSFFTRELGSLARTIATNTVFSITLPQGLRAWGVSAYPTTRHARTITVSVGDLTAGDETTLVFDLTTRDIPKGTRLPIDMILSWTDTDTGRAEQKTLGFEGLVAGSEIDAQRSPADLDIAEQAALQRAAQQQREAMRLDLQGRYRESRQMHQKALGFLMNAPRTATVTDRAEEALRFAEYDADRAYAEDDRKSLVHRSMRRARGRRDES